MSHCDCETNATPSPRESHHSCISLSQANGGLKSCNPSSVSWLQHQTMTEALERNYLVTAASASPGGAWESFDFKSYVKRLHGSQLPHKLHMGHFCLKVLEVLFQEVNEFKGGGRIMLSFWNLGKRM